MVSVLMIMFIIYSTYISKYIDNEIGPQNKYIYSRNMPYKANTGNTRRVKSYRKKAEYVYTNSQLDVYTSKNDPMKCPELLTFSDEPTESKATCNIYSTTIQDCELAQKMHRLNQRLSRCTNNNAKLICQYSEIEKVENSYAKHLKSYKKTFSCHKEDFCLNTSVSVGNIDPRYGYFPNVKEWPKFDNNEELERNLEYTALKSRRNGFNFILLHCNPKNSPRVDQLLMLTPHLTNDQVSLIETEGSNRSININFLVLDSLSRPHFFRMLPKTVSELFRIKKDPTNDVEVLDFQMDQSVAPYTIHNIRGLMSGKIDQEKSERMSYKFKQFLELFKKKGYYTLFQEDSCWYDSWGTLFDARRRKKTLKDKTSNRKAWKVFQMVTRAYQIDDYGLSHVSCEIFKRHGSRTNQYGDKTPSVCLNNIALSSYFLEYAQKAFLYAREKRSIEDTRSIPGRTNFQERREVQRPETQRKKGLKGGNNEVGRSFEGIKSQRKEIKKWKTQMKEKLPENETQEERKIQKSKIRPETWIREPFLSYTHINSAHEHSGMRIHDSDEGIASFVSDFAKLDNTWTIILSDHGAKSTSYSRTKQGRLETYHSFMFMLIPKRVRQFLGEDRMVALKENQRRLMTLVDLHHALMELVQPFNDTFKGQRGLFTPISPNRTCSDIPMVGYATCICQDSVTEYSDNLENFKPMANFAVSHLNNLIDRQFSMSKAKGLRKCSRLHLNTFTGIREKKLKNGCSMTTMYVNVNSRKPIETFEVQVKHFNRKTKHKYKLESWRRISIYQGFEQCRDKTVDVKLCIC